MAVTDDAISKIKDMLISGELKAGDKLAPEKELSEKLGLSRSSLREAIKALELVRVVDVRRGDGTYVTSLDAQLLHEAIGFVVELHQDRSILGLFEVRRVLEGAAVFNAAKNISAEQLADLRALLEGVNAQTAVPDLVEHDLEFHGIIAKASGNSYMAGLLDALAGSTVRARVWRGLTQDKAVSHTLDEHRAIVRALEHADADLARALMMVHISGVESWLSRLP